MELRSILFIFLFFERPFGDTLSILMNVTQYKRRFLLPKIISKTEFLNPYSSMTKWNLRLFMSLFPTFVFQLKIRSVVVKFMEVAGPVIGFTHLIRFFSFSGPHYHVPLTELGSLLLLNNFGTVTPFTYTSPVH